MQSFGVTHKHKGTQIILMTPKSLWKAHKVIVKTQIIMQVTASLWEGCTEAFWGLPKSLWVSQSIFVRVTESRDDYMALLWISDKIIVRAPKLIMTGHKVIVRSHIVVIRAHISLWGCTESLWGHTSSLWAHIDTETYGGHSESLWMSHKAIVRTHNVFVKVTMICCGEHNVTFRVIQSHREGPIVILKVTQHHYEATHTRRDVT